MLQTNFQDFALSDNKNMNTSLKQCEIPIYLEWETLNKT